MHTAKRIKTVARGEKMNEENNQIEQDSVSTIKCKTTAKWDTIAIIVLCCLIAAITLLKVFVVTNYLVDGESMLPTLKDGQMVFVQKVNKSVDYGDIVVLKNPLGKTIIKRVVALKGDTVLIEKQEGGYRLSIKCADGELRADVYNGFVPGSIQQQNLYNLKEGSFLVESDFYCMGDNRNNSLDSRYWGGFSTDSLIGIMLD